MKSNWLHNGLGAGFIEPVRDQGLFYTLSECFDSDGLVEARF